MSLYIVPCLSGQYWNGSTTKYRSIEPGLYMSELVPTCTVCPIGHYQSNMAATECLSCPIYYTTENEGATSREECQGMIFMFKCISRYNENDMNCIEVSYIVIYTVI